MASANKTAVETVVEVDAADMPDVEAQFRYRKPLQPGEGMPAFDGSSRSSEAQDNYEEMFLTGVSSYGQMTAGSFCYIGPQGIVHGTVLTLLNAGRKYLGMENLKGKVFITAGEFCPRVVRCFLS